MVRFVNMDFQESGNQPGGQADLMAREVRICPVCSTKFSTSKDGAYCPACMLRKAIAGAESDESVYENAVDPTREGAAQRFENFELVTDADGDPIELGRGAMGVTYKAFDTNLRCEVALKVIHPRYLTDESSRARFLSEARAAAQLRHRNIASVFHLGSERNEYFYAMELVEGETIEDGVRRKGPIDCAAA